MGKLSIIAVGEIFMNIDSLKEHEDRYLAFETISDIIKAKKIGYYVPKRIDELLAKIRTFDTRITGTDTFILACAIEDGANLITIDKDLLNSRNIQREFNIRILHPKDLI